MAFTLDAVGDDDRRLLRRLASLIADLLVTKNAYPTSSSRPGAGSR